jgi:hypothetical protein
MYFVEFRMGVEVVWALADSPTLSGSGVEENPPQKVENPKNASVRLKHYEDFKKSPCFSIKMQKKVGLA